MAKATPWGRTMTAPVSAANISARKVFLFTREIQVRKGSACLAAISPKPCKDGFTEFNVLLVIDATKKIQQGDGSKTDGGF